MQLTKPQSKISQDPSRFRVVGAGRRFGKSYLSINELAKFARIPNQKCLYVAPTYRQAKQVIWDELVGRLREVNWLKRINQSDLHIQLVNGSVIYIRSADNKEALRGARYNFIVMDECADIDADTWYTILRPTLSDSKGHALFIGSPKGRNWFYEIWNNAKHLDDWSSYQFTTLDGGNVDQDEIDAAKRDLDERSFRQEYMAEWVDYSGLIYYAFSEANVQEKEILNQPQIPLHTGWDFNVDPGVCCIAQLTSEGLHVFDEIEMFGTNTQEIINEVNRRYPQRRIIAYPDAAGSQRRSSANGVTDHILLKNAGYKLQVGSVNPAVKDRIAAVNSALRNNLGQTKLTISTKCKKLINCLSKQVYKEGTRTPEKGEFDHFNDALGYMVNSLYPINVERTQNYSRMRRNTGRM